jgi:hypothetical protein
VGGGERRLAEADDATLPARDRGPGREAAQAARSTFTLEELADLYAILAPTSAQTRHGSSDACVRQGTRARQPTTRVAGTWRATQSGSSGPSRELVPGRSSSEPGHQLSAGRSPRPGAANHDPVRLDRRHDDGAVGPPVLRVNRVL